MKTQRIYKLLRQCEEIIDSCYSITQSSRATNDCHSKTMAQRLYSNEEYSRLPNHAKQYLNGYDAARYKLNWREVIWVHRWCDKVYLDWAALPNDAREFFSIPANVGKLVSAHVWRNTSIPSIPPSDGKGNLFFKQVENGDPVDIVKEWTKWSKSEDNDK